MLEFTTIIARPAPRTAPARLVRPALENLESRLLLYSTLGDMWTYDSRITYSFMPDGTSVGGVPSALFQTLNTVAPTATWEAQFEQAASLWETAANVNLALVPDGGEPVGTNGDQQDDPRFGDIRIGAIPLGSGVLAETFLPPPANGGTDAGDILFNSQANWNINSTYDVMTVAAHEFGHALGLGESTVTSAVMYGTYNGTKQVLTSDDISGINSIYGAHQYDHFNSGGSRNSTFLTATNITSDINAQSQISLAGLDNTTPIDAEWYVVTVPSTTTGQMTVSVQTANLSSLAPEVMVYSSTLGLLAGASSMSEAGVTVSTTLNVSSGQKYYFKVLTGGTGTVGTVGAYGLLVNFGSQSQAPIPPPNTVVPQEPDGVGGMTTNAMENTNAAKPAPNGDMPGTAWATVGNLSGWVAMMYAPTNATGNPPCSNATAVSPANPASTTQSLAGDSMGVLPGFSMTDAAPNNPTTSPTVDSHSGQDSGAGTATPPPTVDVLFQAVDITLQGWKSRRKQHVFDSLEKHHR